MDPRRGALEHVEMPDPFGDLGDELDRRRAGPDHRDPLAFQVQRTIPLRRGEGRPAEPAGPRNAGVGGQVQRAARGYHGPRPVAFPPPRPRVLAGRDIPAPGLVVPVHPLDRAAVTDVLGHAVFARAHPQVLPDLPLRSEQPAPRRVQLEGVGVQRGGHVAGAGRILVVVPGPPEVVAFLQDHEIVEAGLLQGDRHPDTAESGANDHDPGHVWTITQPIPPAHSAAPSGIPGPVSRTTPVTLFEYSDTGCTT